MPRTADREVVEALGTRFEALAAFVGFGVMALAGFRGLRTGLLALMRGAIEDLYLAVGGGLLFWLAHARLKPWPSSPSHRQRRRRSMPLPALL